MSSTPAAAAAEPRPSSLILHPSSSHAAWRRLARNRPALAGLAIIVLFSLIALLADVIAPYPYAQQDTSIVPDSGPTVASRTAMVVGGLIIRAARRLRAQVEAVTDRPFADSYRDFAREHGGVRVDERFEPYPNVEFDDATYTGDAYPAFGWACAVARAEVDLDTGEVTVRDVVSADDAGRMARGWAIMALRRAPRASGRRHGTCVGEID